MEDEQQEPCIPDSGLGRPRIIHDPRALGKSQQVGTCNLPPLSLTGVQLIPQQSAAGVTKLSFITPIDSLITFGVVGGVVLSKKHKATRCVFHGDYAY